MQKSQQVCRKLVMYKPEALTSWGNIDITDVESAFEEQEAKVCRTVFPLLFLAPMFKLPFDNSEK